MKEIRNKRFCGWYLCLALMLWVGSIKATTISSRAGSGNWSDTAHWSPAQIPTSSDSVIISTGNSITVGYYSNCGSINIQSGATLSITGYSLTVYGNFHLDGYITGNFYLELVGTNKHMNGSATFNFPGKLYITSNYTIDNGFTIAGTGLMEIFGAITITNYGSVETNITFSGTGGTWVNGTNSFLTFDYDAVGSFTLNASAIGNTVLYTWASYYIWPSSAGYYNLYLKMGNPKQLTSNVQVNNDFYTEVHNFDGNGDTLSVKGNAWIEATTVNSTINFNGSGTQNLYNNAGISFNNLSVSGTSTVIVNYAGMLLHSLTLNSGSIDAGVGYNWYISGNWTNNGGAFVYHNGTTTFNSTSPVSISRSVSGTNLFYNTTFAGSSTVSLANDIKIANSLVLSSGTLSALSSNILLGANWSNTGGTFSPGTGTVEINGCWTSTTLSKSSGSEQFYNLVDSIPTYTTTVSCPINVANNLTVYSATTWSTGSHPIYLGGNWTNNGTFTNSTGSLIVLNGSGSQTINKGSGTETFRKLTVNKGGGTVTLNCPLTVPDTLRLTRGSVVTTSTNILKLNNGTGFIGGSDSSYVSGPMDKVGNSAFTFPLGSTSLSTGAYHPLTITAPSSTTDEFVAQYYPTGQTYGTTRADSIEGISACEYWTLNHMAGTSSVSVGLNFNTNCPVQGNANISLASWNGTTWLDRNGTKSFGNWPKGSVTMTSPMSVSGLVPFALIYKQITGGYAELKRKLDGGYFIVPKGTLYFKFDDEYNSGSPHLTYQLYNGSRQDLSASLISYDPASSNPVTIYGDNRFGLDMATSGGALSSGYYVLEVTNEKSEKRYLRVKMP
jgi:hypothetical protein